MDLMTIFNAYPGIHVVQAFFHALIAAIIADRAVAAWGIRSSAVRQQFHLVAVFGPVFSYPLYQWLNPGRGSVQFRLDALFDSGRWLGLELWGVLPVGLLFIALLVATTAIFLVQELVPILRHESGPQDAESETALAGAATPAVRIVAELADVPPDVFIEEDDDPAIHSVTSQRPAIYLTTGLLQCLEPAELRVAIAHELAHIRRSRRPLLIVAYIMRVLLFFSPGTLVGFRKAADEEEKVCDDWAVAATGRADALATVLEKLRHSVAYDIEEHDPGEALRAVERMSYDLMVRDRIRRLVEGEAAPAAAGDWLKFAATFTAIAIVCYYVV